MKSFWLISHFLLSLALAQEPARSIMTNQNDESQLETPSLHSLLPAGSTLEGVMLPRYDLQRNLTEVMKAKTILVHDEKSATAKKVDIQWFKSDGSSQSALSFESLDVDLHRNLLKSNDFINMQSDRIRAQGHGIRYFFKNKRGFLIGPIRSVIQAAPRTTMRSPISPRHLAALSLTISIPTLLLAETPAPSSLAQAESATASTSESLKSVLKASTSANQEAAALIEQAELPSTSATSNSPTFSPKPLELKATDDDSTIDCDGGMYFDAEKNILVFLKNVRIQHPDFQLSGANELKVFFQPKATATNEKTSGAVSQKTDFSKVSLITASGAVKITQKSKKEKEAPIEASAAMLSYDLNKEEILLHGGYPWVTQGSFYARATQPNLTLHLFPKTHAFRTEGSWQIGGKVDSIPNR